MKFRNQVLALNLVAMTISPMSACWASINPDVPSPHTAGSITYVSGNGDPAQTSAMGSEASAYPLELDFLWGRGAKETPIGNVEWSIRNAAGHVLVDASSSSPMVLASLPDGRYTVTARFEEKRLSRVVDVHKGTHDAVLLEWPQ